MTELEKTIESSKEFLRNITDEKLDELMSPFDNYEVEYY